MVWEQRKMEVEARVFELLEPLVLYNGMELVCVECIRGPRGPVLRLVIDKQGGVTIDDCAYISRVAGDVLDIHDPMPGSYNLEVSSPGINRPLIRQEDFNRFSGQKVLIKTVAALDGRKRFRGILKGIRDGRVVVEASDQLFSFPLESISKARLDIL